MASASTSSDTLRIVGQLTTEGLPAEVTERYAVLRRLGRPEDQPPDVEHIVRDGWVFAHGARRLASSGDEGFYLVPTSIAVRPPVAETRHLEFWLLLSGTELVMASGKRYEPELRAGDGWMATVGDFFAGIAPDGVRAVELELNGTLERVTVADNFWHVRRPDDRSYPAVRPLYERGVEG
jgi:hypothetical protein